jgi:AraC-like DNA-binding protein
MHPTAISRSADYDLFLSSITQSDLFMRYRRAFRQATGRLLRLIDSRGCKQQASAFPHAILHHIPVDLNGQEIGFLSVDPYRLSEEDGGDALDKIAHHLLDQGATPAQLRATRKSLDELPVMSKPASEAVETMLQIFAQHLGDFSERLFLQTHANEPQAVIRARKYILENLAQPLTLESVAARAGMSECYFCKVFKRATGLTFTEFVTKARIEKAKRLLQRPQSRVTEVAYDVGFQSLSQFNRSFRKVTRQSPTEYRCSTFDLARTAA